MHLEAALDLANTILKTKSKTVARRIVVFTNATDPVALDSHAACVCYVTFKL